MKLSALLTLNITDRTIRDPFDGLSVQRDPHGIAAWRFAANDVNGAHGFTPRPLFDGIEALLSEKLVT